MIDVSIRILMCRPRVKESVNLSLWWDRRIRSLSVLVSELKGLSKEVRGTRKASQRTGKSERILELDTEVCFIGVLEEGEEATSAASSERGHTEKDVDVSEACRRNGWGPFDNQQALLL